MQPIAYKLLDVIASGRACEVSLGIVHHQGGFKRACTFKRLLPTYRTYADRVDALRAEVVLGQSLQHEVPGGSACQFAFRR